MIRRLVFALVAAGVLTGSAAGGSMTSARYARPALRHHPETVYVLAREPGAVVPILVKSGGLLAPIGIGHLPATAQPVAAGDIAITPDGTTAYVVSPGLSAVSVIRTRTNKVIATIDLGASSYPTSVVVTPDGSQAYVLEGTSVYSSVPAVVPVSTKTNTAGPPIMVGSDPVAMIFSKDSRTGYVLVSDHNQDPGFLLRVDTRTNKYVSPELRTGIRPDAMAITPNGQTIYVVNSQNPSNGIGDVLPVGVAAFAPGKPITVGWSPNAIAITPDGRTAYVVDSAGAAPRGSSQSAVTPISLATGKPAKALLTGFMSSSVLVTPNGKMAYVLNTYDGAPNGPGTVTPIRVPGNQAAPNIQVGQYPAAFAITPDSATLYVVNTMSDSVTPIATATDKAGRPIRLGGRYTIGPVAIAITP